MLSKLRRSLLVAGTGLVIAAATSSVAVAKATYESPYGFTRTWNAAVRWIRVDNGWKVTEKDEAGGYLLFEYRAADGSKTTAGSLELVRGREADAPINVLVQVPRLPHYHEQVILNGLQAKMRQEYGEPPEGRHSDPDPGPGREPEAPDAGTD